MDSKPILFREDGAPRDTPPLILFFEEKAVKDERASRAGPAIYDRVTYVKVQVPGSKGDAPIYEICRINEAGERKVDQHSYRRFGKPYEEWAAGHAPAVAGTPLEQWPLMDVVLVAKFKDVHIYTVQQLAGTADSALMNLRQGLEWKAKAQSWLSDAKDAAGDAQARAELAEARGQIAELQAQVKQLLQKQNGIGFDKPKRGRKTEDDLAVVVSEDDLEPEKGYRL